MSQENVRLVERAVAAINARDIEGYLACCTENVKLETQLGRVARFPPPTNSTARHELSDGTDPPTQRDRS